MNFELLYPYGKVLSMRIFWAKKIFWPDIFAKVTGKIKNAENRLFPFKTGFFVGDEFLVYHVIEHEQPPLVSKFHHPIATWAEIAANPKTDIFLFFAIFVVL